MEANATAECAQSPIIKEFAAQNRDTPRSAGYLTVRSLVVEPRLAVLDELYETMAKDALEFDPPLLISREDAQIRHFDVEQFRRTFGLEVTIPAGHIIPDDYTRSSLHHIF